MEALVNMADVMAEIWPLDNTPRILLRILIHYKFGASVRDGETDRCRIIAEFADGVLRENASRAVGRQPPLSFRQAKERWGDVVERYGPPAGRQSRDGGKQGGGGGTGGNGGGGGQQQQNSGNLVRNRGARFLHAGKQYAVCFDYNRGSCGRKVSGCGCEDAKGIVYAHACNYFLSNLGRHCLALH
jgi:hypothetical protein